MSMNELVSKAYLDELQSMHETAIAELEGAAADADILLMEEARVINWAYANRFPETDMVYGSDDFLVSSNFTWPDGNAGSKSNIVTGSNGYESIRFNRPDGKYVTIIYTYHANGMLANKNHETEGYS